VRCGGGRQSGGYQLQCCADPIGVERFASGSLAPDVSGSNSILSSLGDKPALEMSDCAKHVEYEFTGGG
jgi:hypothetical protein